MAEPSFVKEYRVALRRELAALLNDDQTVFSMLRYHMGWSDEQGQPASAEGKMVRGILCLEAARAVAGDYRHALPAAAAVELVHNFSLIHDDIEDASPLRRQRRTLWKIWGQPRAVNAGDAMLVLAHHGLLKATNGKVSHQQLLRAAAALDSACLELCEGQEEDLLFETRLNLRMDDYLRMVSHKTGALFEAALLLGAVLSTNDERLIRGLGAFGKNLGIAFQFQDDELGIWGNEGLTGKSASSDIYEKKKSLPIIYALEEASGEDGDRLRKIYQQERLDSGDEAAVRQILENVAARTFTQAMAQKYFHASHADLDSLGLPSESTREIRETVSSLLDRQA